MKRVLVGYDGSQGSERALNKSLSLVEEDGEIILVAVIPSRFEKSFVDNNAYRMAKIKAEDMIKERVKEIKSRGINAIGVVERGDAADKIIELANDLDCDLIILGRKGQSEIRPSTLGSIAERVVKYSHKPVMIVR